MLGLSIKKQGCENYLSESYHLKSWMKVTTPKINLSEEEITITLDNLCIAKS